MTLKTKSIVKMTLILCERTLDNLSQAKGESWIRHDGVTQLSKNRRRATRMLGAAGCKDDGLVRGQVSNESRQVSTRARDFPLRSSLPGLRYSP